jgi:ABC-2 type transport system permease protein
MMRYVQLLGVQLRTSLAQAMAYRANFLIEGVMSLAWLGLAILPLMVIFDDRESVAGWDRSSALVVMAYFMAIKGIMEGWVSPSLVGMVEKIRTGAFDYVLLKPVDAQFMVSSSRYEPWNVFDVLGALGLCIFAFVERGHGPSLAHVAVGIALLVTGVLAMYSLWVICAAMSFWVVRLDNLVYLIGALFDTARWPVQVFRGAWRIVFTFAIPVALMTTYPAMALLGRLDARTAVATALGSIAMLVVSRLVWRAAIRNYTSASS